MDKEQRIEEVGKHIEKYYVPGYDDIEVDDVEVKGFFDKITEFLAGKKRRKKLKLLKLQWLQKRGSRF